MTALSERCAGDPTVPPVFAALELPYSLAVWAGPLATTAKAA
jgi:hypothetical protein